MRWRLGVAGYPIEHSLSPRLHEAGLTLAGLEGASALVPLRADEAGRLRELMGTSYDALSVTMPLKEVAAAQCDHLDAVAARVGAVNSLLWRDGRLWGASTDGAGLVAALEWQLDVHVSGRHVAVLGAGGAAASIVDALVEGGAALVAVLGRTPSRVARLSALSPVVLNHEPAGVAWDLIINTVPVEGRAGQRVLDGATPHSVALDVAYEPRRTPWRAQYEETGCRSANGLAMLAFQAAAQMRWWWGVEVDGARLWEVIE